MSAARTDRGGLPPVAFRLKPPPEPLESDLQAAAVRTLSTLLLPPAIAWSAAIGCVKLTPQQAAQLTRAGVKRGLPDLMILVHGKLYGIELKRARNAYLSKTRIVHTRRGSPRILEGQEDVFPKLRAAGMTIAIVHSLGELLAQLIEWNIPMRRWT